MNLIIKLLPLLVIIITSSSCNKGNENLDRLAIGESRTLTISSELRWNKTGIQVESGETYSFSSQGSWTDLNTETDADGYNDQVLDSFSSLKRDTSAKWFELVTSVDSITLHRVGTNNNIMFNEAGKLAFFANDAEGFYENNSGSINTTITRK